MKITRESILSAGFSGRSLFHPKVAALPEGKLLMLLQEIRGSDSYGPVLQAFSENGGHDWSVPEEVPPLGWSRPDADGIVEGVCDTVPDLDPASNQVVAVGHSVFYRNSRFFDTLGFWNKADCRPDLRRNGVYSVRRSDGTWTKRLRLVPEPLADCECACCGNSQKVIDAQGNWFIPFYFRRAPEDGAFSVAVAQYRFDGVRFSLVDFGNAVENKAGRGLLEPSLASWNNRVWMTLRAEDGHAYYTTSADGLHFDTIAPWIFDDGTPFVTSTTQQHFARLDGRFYLLYTRDAGFNHSVFRFRTPLFMAEIDAARKCLLHDTECVLLDTDGDYDFPEGIGIFGNFMPFSLKPEELLVSDGMVKPYRGYVGLTFLARIKA